MNRAEINVTPLIDVLLVLLIIFIVITPLKPYSFETRIPSDTAIKPDQPDPRTLVVSYNADSSIMVNKVKTNASIDDTVELIEALKEIFQARNLNSETERTVFIKAPKSSNYGSVALLIDAVKAAGADPISLQIDYLD